MPAQLELTPAWQQIRTKLRETVGDSTFDVWLADLEVTNWDGSVLVLKGKPGTESWVSERFGRVLERCAKSVIGQNVKVAFKGDPATAAREALEATNHTDPAYKHEQFIPRYTFDQFIIGDGNHLAHAAALAVAEAPGQAYNPLFMHAPPGLGKTHLLHAIANYLSAYAPQLTVRYATAEAFTDGFLTALRGNALERFKHLYRDVDVLLMDDIQFLESKAKTEEEFFHTFNTLFDSGRQLVLTCDRLPSQLVGIEQRLRARFEAGLVTTLAAPDRATRIAILRKRASLDRIEIEDQAVFDLIADSVTDNIRTLEGALIKVVASHSLTGEPINAALARRILGDSFPQAVNNSGSRQLTVEKIQEIVADHFRITADELRSQTRAAKIAWPRQLAFHLARDLTSDSLEKLGEAFGGRSHATVLHSCKVVSKRISTNNEDQAELTALRQRLTVNMTDRGC